MLQKSWDLYCQTIKSVNNTSFVFLISATLVSMIHM